ncbi:MAG: twin-arginine translocase subunit TatC [Planctomycetes bacterium]|nr:twin-arginine translocase subunit TatC [Planctomycetota bacterium]MCB9936055.1 twin-arginine translocase subunit TatC [Planctomycetota bacterium]
MPDDTAEPVSFSSHLDELRKRLIWSLLGVFVVFSVVFATFADDIVRYILDIAVDTRDGHRIQFVVINPMETFSTTMRVSLYAAVVFAYPWVMLQAYLFIAPGLYRHERGFFRFAIPSIFVLFMGGAAFGRYVLLPISIPFLLSFNVNEFGVQESYTLGQYLGLIFAMTFGLGFIFQIPLVVAPLIRFGLLSPEFFKSKRRYTILIAVIIGAIVSPTGSPIDMFLAGMPVFFLVEGGVWIGRLWKRQVLKRAEKEALAAAERGEKVDPEALAGGLAIDLEKKLQEFSRGGARKFARELVAGFRESGQDIETIFDDDYKDTDKPPVEVKLKPRKPKFEQETATATASAESRVPSPVSNTAGQESAVPSPVSTATAAQPSEPQDTGPGTRDAGQAAPDTEQEYPDRPWDENVDENLARYIEDRISQRMEQFFERELRPWMDRIEHELQDRNGKNGGG